MLLIKTITIPLYIINTVNIYIKCTNFIYGIFYNRNMYGAQSVKNLLQGENIIKNYYFEYFLTMIYSHLLKIPCE